MAGQRGWVSVRDGDGSWRLLSLYDDGWCAAPVAVPTAEQTRARLRRLIAGMVAVVVLFGGSAAAAVWATSVPWLTWLLLGATGVLLATVAVRAARRRGAARPPVFGSAAEHAAAVDGAVLVARQSVRSVAVQREGHEDVVTVAVRRGRELVYRSPDRTLGRLFSAWSPTPRD